MKRLSQFSFFIFLIIFSIFSYATEVTTTLDRTEIGLGDTVQISYTITDAPSTLTPDFSPLEKDFEIIGRSNSKRVSFINGNTSIAEEWSLTLLAKNKGLLTIPSIQFDNTKSQAQQVKITENSKNPTQDQGHNTILEASVDINNPYVQSQVIYTVKLLYANHIMNASLTDPEVDSAIFMHLGSDKRYQTQRQGKLYQVLERTYAIYPQQHGELTIKPPIFKGIAAQNNSYYSQYDTMLENVGLPIKLVAPTITLHVKPSPATFHNTWLPAKDVTLEETWSDKTTEFKVGEPISRKITIRAEGLTAAQIPDLSLPNIEHVNIYPDKAKKRELITNNSIVGIRSQNIAYVPTQAGELFLPEIKLEWWDTQNQQIKVAKLPAHKFTIIASSNSLSVKTDKPLPSQSFENNLPVPAQKYLKNISLPWILAGSFAIAWLITLVLWQRNRQPRVSSNTDEKIVLGNGSQQHIRKKLKKACEQNDKYQTKTILLEWALLQWPEKKPSHIAAIIKLITDLTFIHELKLLDEKLYAANDQTWDGKAFWRAFNNWHEPKQKSEKNVIPPLYPNL